MTDKKNAPNTEANADYLAKILAKMTSYPHEFWIALNALTSPTSLPRTHYVDQLEKLRELGLCELKSERATPAAAVVATLGRALLWSEMERRIAIRAGVEAGALLI